MAINLEGIVLIDAEILVSGADSIFITSANPKLLSEIFDLPFQTARLSNVRAVCWTGGTDAIAVAERIALSWEVDGFKVNRLRQELGGNKTPVQSFILA